ncbi:MAG TPA: hypothetical protein VM933_11530, partial [Acidimicrobiales bacterium]|nr:hypothetical protein [Acidimicrobiales bacterium]
MACERLTAGLEYDRRGAVSAVLTEGEEVLRFRRGEGRAHLDLVLLGGWRTVEISLQPAAAVRLVGERARRRGADANGWSGALAGAVRTDAASWGLAVEGDGSLLRVLGGTVHPALAAAYGEGAGDVDEVPRWAAVALARPTMRAAAETWFGAATATRPVVRGLALALARLPSSWWRLAAATAGAEVLEPSDLAAVLSIAGDDAVGPLPTAEDLTVLRAGLGRVGPSRARRLLAEAVAEGARRRPRGARRPPRPTPRGPQPPAG